MTDKSAELVEFSCNVKLTNPTIFAWAKRTKHRTLHADEGTEKKRIERV